jgi:hypothetical protein
MYLPVVPGSGRVSTRYPRERACIYPLSQGAGMYLPVVPGSGRVSARCPREVKENLIFFRNETSLSIIE